MSNLTHTKSKSKVIWYYHCPVCNQFVKKSDPALVIKDANCCHKIHFKCLPKSPTIIGKNHPRKSYIGVKGFAVLAESRRLDFEFQRHLLNDD